MRKSWRPGQEGGLSIGQLYCAWMGGGFKQTAMYLKTASMRMQDPRSVIIFRFKNMG